MLWVLLVLIFGVITGTIAAKKGHNFWLWFFFGVMLFIVALPMAILLKPAELDASGKPIDTNKEIPSWIGAIVLIIVIGLVFSMFQPA